MVKGYQVSYKGDELQFIAVTEGYCKTFTLFGKNRKHFKHDTMPSDSWEKLEEDAKQQSCGYFGMDRTPASCDDCPHGGSRPAAHAGGTPARHTRPAPRSSPGVEEEEQQ